MLVEMTSAQSSGYASPLRGWVLMISVTLVLGLDLHTLLTTSSTVSTAWEVGQVLAFVTYARYERLGAAIFAAVLCAALLTPGAHLLWASALTWVIIIDLVSRGRHWTATGIFLVFYGGQTRWLTPRELLASALLWGAICVVAGLLLRRLLQRMRLLERDAQESREAMTSMSQRLQHDVADTLHDDLAADLTHVLILSRHLRDSTPGHEKEVATIEAILRHSLVHLRALIDSLAAPPGSLTEETSIAELLRTCQKALAQRSMTLDTDIDEAELRLAQYGTHGPQLLGSLVRECTINALKYSEDGDLLSLIAEPTETELAISFTAPWRDHEVPAELHGGHGMYALTRRFNRAGGSLVASRVGNSWSVIATIPAAPPPQHHTTSAALSPARDARGSR